MAIIKIAEGDLLSTDIPAAEALADVEITNRFVKLAQDLKKIAPRSDDFLYFTAIMLHGAEASLIDPKTGEPKKDKTGKLITGGFDDKWKWSCTDSSIDPYSNQNGDIFPSSELKKAFKKWVGRPLCINHQSADVEGVRGIIIDTHWDDKYKRVVGLCALDRKSYPDLAHKVKSGYANCVSMGTAVGRALCTYCQTAAITERDYCECIRNKKGQRINGVKIGEINLDLNPIELSLVVTPADHQAKVLKIVASLNSYVDQRNNLLEEKDAKAQETIEKLDHSVKTIEGQLNRLFAECTDNSCTFVRSADGHFTMVKSAQETPTWKRYFEIIQELGKSDDAQVKQLLYEKLAVIRPQLDINSLRNDTDLLLELTKASRIEDPILQKTYVDKDLQELQAAKVQPDNQVQPQLTSPTGPDKDTNLSGDSTVSVDQFGRETGRIQNPTPEETLVSGKGDGGQQMDAATNGFQFGNYASADMAKGGKTTADLDETLSLLLKQTELAEKAIQQLKTGKTTNNNEKNPNTEEIQMNDARLRRRAEARRAMLKNAEKEMCKECEKMECECEETAKKKEAYWQGTEEPTPGKPQYAKDPLSEKARETLDKQMHPNPKSLGGTDGLAPGDLEVKEKMLRAELEERAMKRRAYWLGTEEPTPGKAQYSVDPLRDKLRESEDKQMKQTKSMGGADGMFPGDEAEKKKMLRAELEGAVLRTKFTKVRDDKGEINKTASYFEVFAGGKKILTATAEELYGPELDKYWDFVSSVEYGKQVISAIRKDGFEKVAGWLKGPGFLAKTAQAMPEMPAAPGPAGDMPALPPMPEGGEAGEDVDVKGDKATEVDSALTDIEDRVSKIRDLEGGKDDGVVDIDINVEDKGEGEGDASAAEDLGKSLASALVPLAKEIYAELDQSADELALIFESFEKSASLTEKQKEILNKVADEAIADSRELMEEADVLIAVAKKADEDKKDKKDKKEKDKKKGKIPPQFLKGKKKKDEKDEKKDKKKKKKAELQELLMKLADHLEDEEIEMPSILDDMEAPEMGEDEEFAGRKEEMEEEDADEFLKELKDLDNGLDMDADDSVSYAEDMKENCHACGMAMDGAEHACTASKEEELVKGALADRKNRRETLAAKVVKAEEKKYDVTKDEHGMIGDAHKGSEANPTTQLDVKPAGDGAVVEGLDKVKDKMMDAAEAAPTGKQGAAGVTVKESAADPEAAKYYKGFFGEADGGKEYATELTKDFINKKAEDEKAKYRVKMRRAYDVAIMMQDKGLLATSKASLEGQVDEIMKFSDDAFEAFKRSIENTRNVKTASAKAVLQSGVREDNSEPSAEATGLDDVLKKLGWS